MNTLKHTVLALALAAISTATAARLPGEDVQEIIRKTKSIYNATGTTEVKFEQEGTTGSMRGTITYAQGNRFRLELPKQTIVSDGRKTWTYMPEKNQVVVSKSASGRGRLTPNDLLTAFPGDYSVKLTGEQVVNGRPVWVVRCVPGSGNRIADVNEAVLYIDKSTYRFQQIDITSESMGRMKLRITSAKYDPKVSDARFTFVPPKGSRVVDMSK